MTAISRLLGAFGGGAVGLFLPPLLVTFWQSQASYEVVMGWWCLSVPLGAVGGALLAGRLGKARSMRRTATQRDEV